MSLARRQCLQSMHCSALNLKTNCAQKVVAESGFSGLYRGVAAPLVGQMFFRQPAPVRHPPNVSQWPYIVVALLSY